MQSKYYHRVYTGQGSVCTFMATNACKVSVSPSHLVLLITSKKTVFRDIISVQYECLPPLFPPDNWVE